jgi:hypothetical protein
VLLFELVVRPVAVFLEDVPLLIPPLARLPVLALASPPMPTLTPTVAFALAFELELDLFEREVRKEPRTSSSSGSCEKATTAVLRINARQRKGMKILECMGINSSKNGGRRSGVGDR